MLKRNSLKKPILFVLLVLLGTSIATGAAVNPDPPAQFDLRDYNGQNYVTSIKDQSGGTCWTHGAMASIEGNLLMTGNWETAGESGEPNLAEYHLDWWNGFNQHNNDDTDPPTGGGLVVHEGGDYRVTSAYLSRGEGAVRDIDGQSFASPPLRSDTGYHYYYVPHIEWYTAGEDLSNINTIKQKIMEHGVMGTCMCYDGSFIDGSYNHYQPPTSSLDPNHAIGIVGWDDNHYTQAPQPGAWLCKNSWGSDWGYSGYFWISYYDKHAGKHPEMGAISFYEAEPMRYDKIYYHDYHGWRNTKTDCSEVFNAFTAEGYEYGAEILTAVSFFTAADSVDYTVIIYDRFEGGELLDVIASKTGRIEHSGLHTVSLDDPVELLSGNDFYVYVSFSAGGHPYDQTSDVPVLLGAQYRVIVESSSQPDQSFYYGGGQWYDLYNIDTTANFCVKALSTYQSYLNIELPDGAPEYITPGQPTDINVVIMDGGHTYVPGSGLLHYHFDGGDFQTVSLVHSVGSLYVATLPLAKCEDVPEYYFTAEGLGRSSVACPQDAPGSVFTSVVGEKIYVVQDNFETDNGWTTDYYGATSGFWQRGVPVDDDAWAYDPATDGDGSGQCWLTQNEMGNTDVDNGTVTLISPIFDLSSGGNIEYDYYLFLTDTEGGIDRLQVEIDDGSGDWIEIGNHDTDGGLYWRHNIITQDEITTAGVSLTATMQIRFTAYDWYPQSIVEAGVDGFEISYTNCENPYICGDANDDGSVNIIDISYLIEYLYLSGPAPVAYNSGDVNSDGTINILDISVMIDFLYNEGPPVDCP
jgi:C1A family cysteine protease